MDRSAMVSALEGISTVFFVSGRESPDRLLQHRAAVRAFVEAGVERVVYARQPPPALGDHLLGALDQRVERAGTGGVVPDEVPRPVRRQVHRFVDAGSPPFTGVPAVPEGTQGQVRCLRFTLRRDEHRLLPPGEPVTLEDHLDALQKCLGRTPDDEAADIGETAESLLRAFGR